MEQQYVSSIHIAFLLHSYLLFQRRKWQPTPVFLPGESHGRRSLVGYIQSTGSQRVGHDWVTPLSLSLCSLSLCSSSNNWIFGENDEETEARRCGVPSWGHTAFTQQSCAETQRFSNIYTKLGHLYVCLHWHARAHTHTHTHTHKNAHIHLLIWPTVYHSGTVMSVNSSQNPVLPLFNYVTLNRSLHLLVPLFPHL